MAARPSFKECLIEDLRMWNISIPDDVGVLRLWKHTFYALIFYHGFACVFHYRINVRVQSVSAVVAQLMGVWRYYRYANDISYYAEIGPGLKINHTSDIVIGKGVVIGRRCSIYNGVTLGARRFDHPREKPVVGDNVTIGTGAKVLGDITVGNHAIIGALTLCTVSVPEHALAIGNPVHIKVNFTQI